MTPLRKKRASAFKAQRKKQAAIRGAKPERDAKYLTWVRSLDCLLCFVEGWRVPSLDDGAEDNWEAIIAGLLSWPPSATPWVEAAHMGAHGLSQKASDYTCIPLCGNEHHREGKYSAHKLGRRFVVHYRLDLLTVQTLLRKEYEAQK